MFSFATIGELRKQIERGHVSAREVVAFYRNRFAQYDAHIRSALEIFEEQSIFQASEPTGSLLGIPGIIKDNMAQKGRVMTCGSNILKNYRAGYDATVISRLKAQGAPIIGRANMDEFAMGSSTETSAFFKTCNPWNNELVPGGSSGGSAAAVAAGFVPWALGSETGGSVRQPAALCGVVGFKPTYGLVSRYGLVAYTSSIDQIGILTRTVADNATILSVIAGSDASDATSLPVGKKEYGANLASSIAGLKIGIVRNALSSNGIDQEVVRAIEESIAHFERLGAICVPVDMPLLDYSAATYFILSRAEAASNLARFDGVRYGMRDTDATTLIDMYRNTRHKGFGKEVQARILIGNYVLSAGHAGKFYVHAKKVQQLIRAEFVEKFKAVDLLLMPSQAMPAFKIGAFDHNKLQMDLQDYFTCPVNLAGLPAISIPCGFTQSNLPIGLQLIGKHLCEELIYQAAHAYEVTTQWHTRRPKIG